MSVPGRATPLEPGNSGLLVIDMQYDGAARGFGRDKDRTAPADDYYFSRLEKVVVPNTRRLIAGFRERGIEVLYTVIESLTRDGRDRGLDHKLSGFHVPKGSKGARVIDPLAPAADEIVIPKTASGVFTATNIDYVLRNLGISRLAMAGVYTSQCVESAVRAAADHGYLVTVVEDACAAPDARAEAHSVRAMAGYARICSTADLLTEIGARPNSGSRLT